MTQKLVLVIFARPVSIWNIDDLTIVFWEEPVRRNPLIDWRGCPVVNDRRQLTGLFRLVISLKWQVYARFTVVFSYHFESGRNQGWPALLCSFEIDDFHCEREDLGLFIAPRSCHFDRTSVHGHELFANLKSRFEDFHTPLIDDTSCVNFVIVATMV